MSEDEKPAETQPSEAKDKAKNRNFKAGVGVGIGSAAIVAAVLYARSGKPRKK